MLHQMDLFGDAGAEAKATALREVEAGALFVVNHSGGKDSKAMLIHLRAMGVPDELMVIVHADLGRVEWPGNVEHIERYAGSIPIIRATARRGLLQTVEERGMFPSPKQRWCTSDGKRGPIEREVRRYLKSLLNHSLRVVNCMGMRAEESPARSRKAPWSYSARNSKARRVWHDFLPIQSLTTTQVFAAIRLARQEAHPIYAQGMSRLSCRFCIMASEADLRTAARLSPELYAEYVALERRIGHTLSMSGRGLEAVTGIAAKGAATMEGRHHAEA